MLPIGLVLSAKTLVEQEKGGNLLDSSRVFDIDEVVVVSQPKEVFRLRKQSISSSSFSNTDLSSVGVRDLRELSVYVPSFVMPNYGARITSSMYIRGIGSRVNNPAVGIYVDGMPIMSKSAFNFHTYQLDRVDVLRGPQGTLYGQNTEGGLVRMYSKNPVFYQGSDVTFGVGTHFWRNAEFGHYARPSEKIAYSLSGFYNGQDGFFRNIYTGKLADKYNESGGKARMLFMPTSRLTFDWIADYQYVDQNGFPYGELNPQTGDVASPSTNYQGNYRRNMFNTGLAIHYKGDGFDLNSQTSYQYLNDHMLMDQDYTDVDFMHLEQNQLQNSIVQELTLKSRSHNAWQWSTGVFGSYQWLKTNAPVFFGDGITAPIANGIQKAMYTAIVNAMAGKMMAGGMPAAAAKAAAKAAVEKAGGVSMNVSMTVPGLFHTPQFVLGLFHETNISITDHLTATIGLRYGFNRVDTRYDTRAAMDMAANVMGKAATYTLSSLLKQSTHNSFNQLLPKLAFNYIVDNNNSNVYLLLSKGYRAGGYNIQMFSDILQTELNSNRQNAMAGNYEVKHTFDDYERINKTIAYKPETCWNYEAGTHLNLFGDMLHLDLSAFYMQVKNQQLSVMAGNYGYGRMMVNAGKSYSCGAELSLRGSAIDNKLAWVIGYGINHAAFQEYKDSVVTENGKQLVDYKNKRVPYVPMHTFSANVDYRFNISSFLLRSITVGANVNGQGNIYWDEANTYSQKMYVVVGAHANFDFGKVMVAFWGRNLTNTKYNTFAVNSSATGNERFFANRANPIQAGVDLNFHF